MKKEVVVLAVMVASVAALGDDVTIPSTYDEGSGKWVGNVVALTNALKNAVANQTIYLSKGVYDLTPLAADRAPSHISGGYGNALIGLTRENEMLVGATGNPEDVLIKADDSDFRILNLHAKGTQVHNVTIKGGYASTNGVSKSSGSFINGYMAGGGVMFIGLDTVVSNCHFTANRGLGAAGAISGNNEYKGTVYDSVFYGNDDSANHETAVVAKYTTLHRCTITNNVYSGVNGYGYVLNFCRVYDSYIAHNSASYCGGLRGGVAVNCRFLHNRQPGNANNWNPGGGAGAREAVLTNCFFYGNVAYRLGGAIREGKAVNCTVVSNRTIHASDAYGGGIYNASLVAGCTVMSNICYRGGGLSDCRNVTNTLIAYNNANLGGGARSSVLTDCTIEHNVAQDYAGGNYGGAGGGIAYGAATNCVFRDNSSSAAFQSTCLRGCDIADTLVNARTIDSCVMHEIQNDKMARAVGNVAYPNGVVTSNIFMFVDVRLMRNCLVTNCTWKSLPGSFVNSAMFATDNNCTGRVENCTFVDNNYYLLTRHFSSSSKQISFVNSVLTGNRRIASAADVTTMESSRFVMSNCVYGVLGSCTAKAAGFGDYGCTGIVSRAGYRFVGKGEHPFSPKWRSPLRGWGQVLGWMGSGVDFVGNPRLRDGKADIGCYQCWLEPTGMEIVFR